jgi:hypothetical protein
MAISAFSNFSLLYSCRDGNAVDICDYIFSGNDKECPDLTDKQTLCHSMSYSNPLSQIREFKDLDSAINEGENTRHFTDDIAMCAVPVVQGLRHLPSLYRKRIL